MLKIVPKESMNFILNKIKYYLKQLLKQYKYINIYFISYF